MTRLSKSALLVALALVGCSDRPMLDPYPSAVVELDTNLPVPLAVSRLRLDVYAEDGRWIDSSDIARPDPRDWPVTFGVFSENESKGSRVWVRARAYLEGERVDYRGERLRDFPDPFVEVAPTDGESPRLIRDGDDLTPETEPQALATVDRLLLVTLEPKTTGRVRALLHGACAGTMVKMGSRGLPDATAETCVDTAKTRVPVTPSPRANGSTSASVQGTWLASPCDADAPASPARVCIPGGATVVGTRTSFVDALSSDGHGTTPPVRIFGVRKFWIDRHEVSVGRYREALARGLVSAFPLANEGPLDPTNTDRGTCTWSQKPMGRDELPLLCIDWTAARDFCRFEGGDLPSEVEWEHAATVAGHAQKQLFPWGNERVECAEAVYGRDPRGKAATAACTELGVLPAKVTDGPGDVTPLGVHGLAGNAREWARDIFAPYVSTCWAESSLENPICRSTPGLTAHTARGGTWLSPLAPLASRVGSDDRVRGRDVGFRCVYDQGEASR